MTLETLQMAVASPVLHNGLVGLLGAGMADYRAFQSWKSFDDAHSYDWKIASWRWLQGFISGMVTGLGLSAMLG